MWFLNHSLVHFRRGKVVLVDLDVTEKFDFENEFFYNLVRPCVVDSTNWPLCVASEKRVWVLISLLKQLFFAAHKHFKLIQEYSLSAFGVFFPLFLLCYVLLSNYFLYIVQHFFVANWSVKVNMCLLNTFTRFFQLHHENRTVLKGLVFWV